MSESFVGEIRLFSFSRVPVGWLACQGQMLAISQYDVLFSLIGTTYGGNGQTTFALPDLRGRVPLKFGTGPGQPTYAIGQAVGEEDVTITSSGLASHSHGFFAANQTADSASPANTLQLGALASDTMYVTDSTGLSTAPLNASAVSPTGGSQPHSNLMPTLTVSYFIATDGIYPSRS